MLDLFSIAADNADGIYKAFNDAVTRLPDDEIKKVNEFTEWVKDEALISINLRLYVIAELLCGNPYRNIYEWAHEQAILSGRTKDDILRERLKGFYDKRIVFDRTFQDGERFRYGALNAGGIGLSFYAPYCAVLTRNFHEDLIQSVCITGDSLEIFFSWTGKIDYTALVQNVYPFSHRHWLATGQRIAEIDLTPENDWPKLLISNDYKQYFEVIFIGDVTLNSLQCVRIGSNEYQQMWELAFANFGRSLSEAERAWVQDFIELLRAQKEGKIQLEVTK